MMSNVNVFDVLIFLYVSVHYAIGGYFVSFPTSKCGQSEICISIRSCPFFDDLLNKSAIPRPRSVIKVIRKNQCGFYRNTPHVCCHMVTPLPPPIEREDRDSSLHFYKESTNAVSKHRNFGLLRNDICGPILTNSRITFGNKAALGEFPWMALIIYQINNELDFRCGGSVINERYVLTAAHCIDVTTIVGVRLGEHNLDTATDCDLQENCAPPAQDFYIEDIKVHPHYDPKTYINDIALIRLATPANFSLSNVQPICLPLSEVDLNGQFVIVSGWGVTETGLKSSQLLKVSLPVVPISKCQINYERFARITSKQMCAGAYKGRDSCGGDSGGPLQNVGNVIGTPRMIQYGIVSYGLKNCGTQGQPGVYTRVSPYMEWILDNMSSKEDN